MQVNPQKNNAKQGTKTLGIAKYLIVPAGESPIDGYITVYYNDSNHSFATNGFTRFFDVFDAAGSNPPHEESR